jgi:pyruvate,water dikinase
MMKMTIPLSEITLSDRSFVGGKAWALSRLLQEGIDVPDGICITSEIYLDFINITGLRDQIQLELHRKPFDEMRWEEIWDLSLRIRNFFLRTPIPPEMNSLLEEKIRYRFGNSPTVVRSSSPSEDSAEASFAGLHESVVNVQGPADILAAVKQVWASLWSDAAILYRKELGLDVKSSTMAVIIQEIVSGERSGVIFTEAPQNRSNSVLEAVWGLNQGFVDGTVEPDRWFLHRDTGKAISHTSPSLRDRIVIPSPEGTVVIPLEDERVNQPPLTAEEAEKILKLGMRVEDIFLSPQDMEWTIRQNRTFLLQSRPVTTSSDKDKDRRSWYLSLTRSMENLQELRKRIEREHLPMMEKEAQDLRKEPLDLLSDQDLAQTIKKRIDIYKRWEKVYRDDLIPFAHGARLFGQFYNDRIKPADPYEFVDLLIGTKMKSLERNSILEKLAEEVRNIPNAREIRKKGGPLPEEFESRLKKFITDFETLPGSVENEQIYENLLKLIFQLADGQYSPGRIRNRTVTEQTTSFLSEFSGKERDLAEELLDLGRASWKIRDNDNIYLAGIGVEVERAASHGRKRITERDPELFVKAEDVASALLDPLYVPPEEKITSDAEPDDGSIKIKLRQLRGQPASPGIATGTARVIHGSSDLFEFRKGEILVCDAIEPEMTFVVPLASAIVERRGGMLIHGAIIAREYGLPCVTGIPKAAEAIATGTTITVDGHLGIVILAN